MTALADRIPATSLVGTCHEAASPTELEAYFGVRHSVFVDEQHIFPVSDRDALDELPGTIHLLACVDGAAAGAVRLYPLDLQQRRWKGDRLAVHPDYRKGHVGQDLVRSAVLTATREGGSVMVAMIQPANVQFFRRLGWSVDGEPVPYVGHPHQPMAIDLWFDALQG